MKQKARGREKRTTVQKLQISHIKIIFSLYHSLKKTLILNMQVQHFMWNQ
jgi:hypothetical protein